MSNTGGGVILVGVRDDGTVVGAALDSVRDRIHQAALDAHDVGRYQISTIGVDDRKIVAIQVRRREEGFSQTSNGRVLVRDGARNTALTGGRLSEFVQRQTLRRFESSPSGIPLSQAERPLLAELCSAFEWDSADSEFANRLMEHGLANERGELTIAGALLLTDPAKSIDHSKAIVEVRRYPQGSVDYDRRVEIGGALHHQVANAARLVQDELGTDVIVTGLYRHELPRLPERVVREAIANAVAHRSYEAHGTAIVIEVRPEELVITSPGGLPEPVTLQTLRQAQAARNSSVIAVLRRFRLAEDAGLGIDVIEDEMSDALLYPPIFSENDGRFVRVALPLRGPITPRERVWIGDLEQRGMLDGSDRLVLVHAARGEIATNKLVRSWLGISESGARTVLRRLCTAGLMVQQGTRGGATYVIARNLSPPAAYRMTVQELEDLVVKEASTRSISNETVRTSTGLDRDQALRLLRHLVESGRLTKTGSRRGTRYHAV